MAKSKYRKAHMTEYRIWKAMRARCSAPSQKNVGNYQKNGIKVCERWNSFDNFFEDMGERPEGFSIDRIDNNLGYSPDNCRWANSDTQAKNRGDFNKFITYNGKTLCLKDWSRELGIRYQTLVQRMHRHPEMSFGDIVAYVAPSNQKLIYNGEEYTRSELCEKYNIPIKTFYDRYHKGWTIERIITTPKLANNHNERNRITNKEKRSSKL